MPKPTYAYFGDGVYARFNGVDVLLTANGIDEQATDRVFLELQMPAAIAEWVKAGCPDHSTGKPYGQE